jgi:hypothetical protein
MSQGDRDRPLVPVVGDDNDDRVGLKSTIMTAIA